MDAEVDRVWSELRFEAAWQSAAERREVRDALGRFLGYHVRADRELVDTETFAAVEIPVPTPEGDEEVRLSGYIDRVERDAEGRLVAIDLKNMKRAVPNTQVPEHGQLGVYQLLLREDGPVGGAALVQLRVNDGSAPGDPKVQMQEALPDERPTWVEEKLGDAVHVLRTEEFTARPSQACTYCAYRSACPAISTGVTP
jgi:RecB family exonuclease